MRAETGDGDEGIAGAHGAAVQHQAGQNGIMARQGHVRNCESNIEGLIACLP